MLYEIFLLYKVYTLNYFHPECVMGMFGRECRYRRYRTENKLRGHRGPGIVRSC